MAADIDIVNRALVKIGERPITSLNDPVKPAKLAAGIYAQVRDSEISKHSWNFAKARMMLASESTPPAFGYKFSYVIPADCLRVSEVGPWPMPAMDPLMTRNTAAWEIEGNHILSNTGPTITVKYVARVTDSGLFPPFFSEALACRLAVEMCEILVSANSKKEMAVQLYQAAVEEAMRNNAVSLPPRMVQDDGWMLAHTLGVFQ